MACVAALLLAVCCPRNLYSPCRGQTGTAGDANVLAWAHKLHTETSYLEIVCAFKDADDGCLGLKPLLLQEMSSMVDGLALHLFPCLASNPDMDAAGVTIVRYSTYRGGDHAGW